MQKIKLRTLCIAILGVLVILFAEHLGLFEGVNAYCYNLAFRLRGPVKTADNIVIAAIDEKSLHQLGRWPLPRSHYAGLLDILHGARAVGFTVIMAEPTDNDQLFAQAVDRHGRVAFPLYIDNRLQVEYPAPLLARFAAGHIHIEQDINGFAKGVFSNIKLNNHPLPVLAATVQRLADGGSGATVLATPQEHAATLSSENIKQKDLMQINYYGPQGTFPVISLVDILKGKIPAEFFSGKLVLVGATAAGLEERMMTPFAQYRDRMSAVEIQANILNNIVDGNSIRAVDEGSRILACLLAAALFFPLFMVMAETGATMVWLFTLAATASTVYLLFTRLHVWLDPGSLFFVVSVLYLTTFLCKLDEAARKLQLECGTIASHLGSAEMRAWRGSGFAGIFSHLSLGGINRKIGILDEATKQLLQHSSEIETANNELENKNSQLAELQETLKARVSELEAASGRVRQLEGIIPICMYCKKIRNDQDYWQKLESYLAEHSDLAFSHGICPDCFQDKLKELDELRAHEAESPDTA